MPFSVTFALSLAHISHCDPLDFTLHVTDNTLSDRVHDTKHRDDVHKECPPHLPQESSLSTDTSRSGFTVDADAQITEPMPQPFPETVFMPLINEPASNTPAPETQHHGTPSWSLYAVLSPFRMHINLYLIIKSPHPLLYTVPTAITMTIMRRISPLSRRYQTV